MTAPPCPADVMAALRSCHIPHSIAALMVRRESFPVEWKQASGYSTVGHGRLQAMWRLGLLSSDPDAAVVQVRKENQERRRAGIYAAKRRRLQKVEIQLARLAARRANLRKERDQLMLEMESDDGRTKKE